MDKHEYMKKSNEIRMLVDQKKYEDALDILETIDVDKVKIIPDLSIYAEVLLQNQQYEDCKDILLRIRERTNGRRVVYQLIRLAVCMKEVDEAEYYYSEYVRIAPKDPERFILRYRIDLMKGQPIEALIQSLEGLKEYDYIEKWAYELAKLYHKAGMKDKCVRECNDIILWFGNGDMVEKAKILKEMYVGTTERIEAIKAETKKEIEEQEQLLKTKDLSYITEQVNRVLLRELELTKQEKAYQKQELQKELEEVLIEPEKKVEEKAEQLVTEFEEEATVESKEEEKEVIVESEEEVTVEPEEEATVEPEEEESIAFFQELEPIFEPFLPFEELMGQVRKSFLSSTRRGIACNYAILGSDSMGKMTLIKTMVQALWKKGAIKSTRIAKISAERFNQIQISLQYEGLRNTCLFLKEAGKLSEEGIESILKLTEQLGNEMVLFLEDTKEEMDNLFIRQPKLREVVKETIELPESNEAYLLKQGIAYFHLQEYEVSDDAVRELKKMIQEIVASNQDKNEMQLFYNKLDGVIKHAEDRTMKQLLEVVTSKQYLNSNLNTILEEDFTE